MERGVEKLRPTLLIPRELDITTILLGHWAQTQTIPDRTVWSTIQGTISNELYVMSCKAETT